MKKMNSLDYINYQIVSLEDSLQHYTMVEPDKVKEIYIKHDLEYLYKIKAELEAWGVVKEEIEYNKEKACSERPDIVYSFKHWSFEINEDQSDFEEKSTKLKKALEVKNNE